ncbi:MAG: tetratricopeptide repeat protein [Pirellula sp.]
MNEVPLNPIQKNAWNPQSPDSQLEIASACLESKHYGRVIEICCGLVLENPALARAHFFLGIAYYARGQYEISAGCFERAIELKPDYGHAHMNLGNAHHALGRWSAAIASYQRAAELMPDQAVVYFNLAGSQQKIGQLQEAARSIETTIELSSRYPRAFKRLGDILAELHLQQQALDAYRTAIEQDPTDTHAYVAMGSVLRSLQRFQDAVACYQQALAINPNSAGALTNLGNVYLDMGMFDEAYHCHEKAVANSPNDVTCLCNLGGVLQRLGMQRQAIDCYSRAIQIDPLCSKPHFNSAIALLSLGEYDRGFQMYEWRWKEVTAMRPFPCPEWDGTSLENRSILLHAEQGLGDTIQIIRLVRKVRERLPARIVVECQPELCRLLSNLDGIDELVSQGSPLPATDLHAPLMSLPRILKLQPSQFSQTAPYLVANAELVDHWRKILDRTPGIHIGICWQGSSRYPKDRFRSIPLSAFSEIANMPGVHLICLQKGAGFEQIQSVNFNLVDFSNALDESNGPFMDTAAIMANLDLIITIDSSIAHLAGALGIKTWVALSAVPDWRWQQQGTTSAWYPSVKLFRQTKVNHWDPVFSEIRNAVYDEFSINKRGEVGEHHSTKFPASKQNSIGPDGIHDQSAITEPLKTTVMLAPGSIGSILNVASQQRLEGKLDEAIDTLRRLLFVEPKLVLAAHALAELLLETNQTSEAKSGFAYVLQLEPNNLNAALKLGVIASQEKKSGEAAFAFQQATKIDPNSAISHRYFGMSLNELSDFGAAVEPLRRAVELEPTNAENHLVLGNALSGLNQLAEAAKCYVTATQIADDPLVPLLNLGNCLTSQGKYQKANSCFRRILSLDPRFSAAHLSLGINFESMGRLEDALFHFTECLNILPNNDVALVNLGVIHDRLREYDKADECFRTAISVAPENTAARFNLGMVHLRNGNWREGFELYELRTGLPGVSKPIVQTPRWNGESLQGKTLLVMHEQGMGDCIQFVRYMLPLKQLGARVLLQCRNSMMRLIRTCEGIDQIVSHKDPLPEHDFHIRLLSLPYVFGTTPNNIPRAIPYLHAERERVDAWRERLRPDVGFKIGIVWRGNPGYRSDRWRSAPLELFHRFCSAGPIQFYSLQKEDVREDIQRVSHLFHVHDFGSELDCDGAFLDSAAIMKCMDLVVSVDTSPNHLAGALGVPVWLALSYSSDWRWMLDRDDTPWYPTAKIFRQKTSNGWPDVFERMSRELYSQLASHSLSKGINAVGS